MTKPINVRVSKETKAELQAAAKAKGVTLSGFLRYAAMIEARRVLAEIKPVLAK